MFILTPRKLGHVERRDDRDDAGGGLGVVQVHPGDAALGDGRTEDETVGLIGHDIVPFVGIGCGAGGLELAVDAIGWLADDLELVDRVDGAG